MTDLITSNTATMSSKDLYDMICIARAKHDESQPRINDFHARIVDELEDEHYESFVVQNPNKTQSTFFRLTLDQCLLVGMRESKAVRRTVISKLKELKAKQQAPALPDFTNPVEAARAWADEVEQKQIAQQALALAAPKAEFYDAVTQSGDAISMDEVAKVLNLAGLGRNKLFKLLREKGVLQTGGVKHNQPYQRHVDAGRFRLVETSWVADNGDVRVNLKTVVLQKGLDYIRQIASE